MVHIAKRQKVDGLERAEEAVLFNSDTLSKIITYLPSIDVLSLALTCQRFSISNTNDDNDEQSLIKESTRIAVQVIATEEQLAAPLPHYEGESSLADYHYLQLMREPLLFDQLVGPVEYVNEEDKSYVKYIGNAYGNIELTTAFSNNIMRAGRHYVSFVFDDSTKFFVGVMRPGEANQYARGSPRYEEFFENFSQTHAERYNISSVHCCLLVLASQKCLSSGWDDEINNKNEFWEGMENMSLGDEIGMLLDLDEGTLSVYKNGQKLGVMKKGLAGPYCWVTTMYGGRATIKRGTIPPL